MRGVTACLQEPNRLANNKSEVGSIRLVLMKHVEEPKKSRPQPRESLQRNERSDPESRQVSAATARTSEKGERDASIASKERFLDNTRLLVRREVEELVVWKQGGVGGSYKLFVLAGDQEEITLGASGGVTCATILRWSPP